MSIQWDKYSKITDDIFDAVGRTPLFRLNRIVKKAGIDAEILGKLEYYSPSGSIKDRIYYNMFKLAIERGELKPGMTILECSTGNAGIACSFVAAVMDYPCIIVMPIGMSEERKLLDMAYGSKMVYTPGGESDVDLALMKVDEIKKS
ncbi:MAG: pyridoxal-phosphate dependent enzyme, partial [candidate division Zixibacteria bacterium]|nr:pyridoxal-phosphate dependent enzyme [candidate division Zixibacteria bacterium]